MAVNSKVAEFDKWAADNPIRRWREAEGISQTRLAAMLGVAQPYVSYWEMGSRAPTPDRMLDIARLMNLRPRTLRGRWENWMRRKP